MIGGNLKSIKAQELSDMMNNNEDFKLLDVREDHELEIARINHDIHIPMVQIHKRMSELTHELRHSYFIKYPELTFEEKIESLFKCLEKIKPSKDFIFARNVCYLAAHNILGSDILKWENFIKDYSEIVPSENEKKLNGNEIQKILKDRKIKLIKQELEKYID